MLNSYDVIKEAYIKSGSIFMDRGVEALGNLDGVKDSKQWAVIQLNLLLMF